MESSVNHLCSERHEDGLSKSAVMWCPECEVFFCGNCEKRHRESRLYKNHNTIPVQVYEKLPSFMQDVSSQCRDHMKTFEMYCSNHACPCCVQCITDKHQKCQDMKPLSDILKNVKASASVHLFEKDLNDVAQNFNNVMKYLKTRISINGDQKSKAVQEIRYLRKSIDNYLNQLEKKIIDNLESKYSTLISNNISLVQQIKQQSSQIQKMQSDFKKMTTYATDLQMYVGLIQIEKSTVQASKYITDLISGDYFKEKNLEVNISSAKILVLQNFKSFGDISINTSPSTLLVNSGRKDQAQHLVPIPPIFEQMKPVLLRRLSKPDNIESLDIRACIVLPDGKFIILDRNKKQLLLYGNDGIFAKKVITMTLIPFDTCLVKKNIVAVTFGRTKQTALIDIEQSTIIQIIKIAHHCNAVASDGQILVISGGEKTTKVNLNDMSYTIVERVRASRIALFQGNIYSTINYCNANEVCCYKSTGELIWRFHHDGIYSHAGLALDKKGFVYIVSQENNDIMVVSPDGKTSKTILSEKDGIKYPWAIDINREEGLMIVSSGISDNELDQTAFVYKI